MKWKGQIDPLTFAVIVILFFSCNKEEDSIPKAEFSYSPSTLSTGEIIHFSNTSDRSKVFRWDFGDGLISDNIEPTHSYIHGGVYEVTLVATSGLNTDTARSLIAVASRLPIRVFEGAGIDKISLGDRWKKVKFKFGTDYEYYYDYWSYYRLHIHQFYYKNEGIIFLFINSDKKIYDNASINSIKVIPPYVGRTENGISLGNSMPSVISTYGKKVKEELDGNVLSYSYPNMGIVFSSFNDSRIVDRIDVFQPVNSETNVKEPYFNKPDY